MKQRLIHWIYRFPKGSIWKTRYVCFPLALVVSTLLLSHPDAMAGDPPFFTRLAWFTLGLVGWTLLEYVFHRWILHFDARSEIGKAIVDRLHVFHHHDPKDQSQVCIPPVLLVFFCFLIYGVFAALGANPGSAALVVSGVGLMMVIYDITHFSVHYMTPSNWLLRKLKQQHMLHHFQDGSRRFGVTSPFWDHVFRTHR